MPKVLVVDDEAVHRTLVAAILKSADFSVFEASDGYSGLQVAKDQHPDLILIDLHMPKMDGSDFLRSMRSQPGLAGTKVVLYTGTAMHDAMRQFMELHHVDHCVSKPAEPAEVLAVVRTALGIGSSSRVDRTKVD